MTCHLCGDKLDLDEIVVCPCCDYAYCNPQHPVIVLWLCGTEVNKGSCLLEHFLTGEHYQNVEGKCDWRSDTIQRIINKRSYSICINQHWRPATKSR